MNQYREFKEKQRKELYSYMDLCTFAAFNKEQFREGMQKLGLDPEKDLDKITAYIGGTYVLKDKRQGLEDIFIKHEKEREAEIEKDYTGFNFCYQMFLTELSDHEYSYTQETGDTLRALGLVKKDFLKYPQLKLALYKACTKLEKHDNIVSLIGEIGRVVVTASLNSAIQQNKELDNEIKEAIEKYLGGNWGELEKEDVIANNENIDTDGGYLGKYKTSQGYIYIDTPAGREYTTIMFSDEY